MAFAAPLWPQNKREEFELDEWFNIGRSIYLRCRQTANLEVERRSERFRLPLIQMSSLARSILSGRATLRSFLSRKEFLLSSSAPSMSRLCPSRRHAARPRERKIPMVTTVSSSLAAKRRLLFFSSSSAFLQPVWISNYAFRGKPKWANVVDSFKKLVRGHPSSL